MHGLCMQLGHSLEMAHNPLKIRQGYLITTNNTYQSKKRGFLSSLHIRTPQAKLNEQNSLNEHSKWKRNGKWKCQYSIESIFRDAWPFFQPPSGPSLSLYFLVRFCSNIHNQSHFVRPLNQNRFQRNHEYMFHIPHSIVR